MVAEGDKVAVRFNITATHKGDFQGIPLTGKQVPFDGNDFLTIIECKIAEDWLSVDRMRLMRQIGAIPADAHAISSSTISSMIDHQHSK
jgi:predicted ester cyclase